MILRAARQEVERDSTCDNLGHSRHKKGADPEKLRKKLN